MPLTISIPTIVPRVSYMPSRHPTTELLFSPEASLEESVPELRTGRVLVCKGETEVTGSRWVPEADPGSRSLFL